MTTEILEPQNDETVVIPGPEVLQEKDLLVCGFPLKAKRVVYPADGDVQEREEIMAIIAPDAQFGDWRKEDGRTNPEPADIELEIASQFGYPVRQYFVKGPDPDGGGEIVIRFRRSEAYADRRGMRDLDGLREWRHEIEAAAREVEEAQSEWDEAAEETKRVKETEKERENDYNAAVNRLRKLIRGEGEPGPLYNRKPSANGHTSTPSPQAPGDDDDSWREVPLTELALPKAILGKLEDADVTDGTRREIKTVGQLADFTKEYGAKGYSVPLTMIRGIGGAANEKVETALSEFWAKRPAPAVIEKDIEKVLEQESEADAATKSWRDCPIQDLDLSDKHTTALTGNNIATVGNLADCLRDNPQRITDLVGKRAHDKLVRLVEQAASEDVDPEDSEFAMSDEEKEEVAQRLEKKGARRGRGNGKHRPDPKRGAKQAKVKEKLVGAGKKGK